MQRDDRLSLVEAPRPEGTGWSARRSVFTFKVRAQDRWLSAQDLRKLYQHLNTDLSHSVGIEDQRTASSLFQIGQPVDLGEARHGGGLRLAISAAQVTARTDWQEQMDAVLTKLSLLLDLARAEPVQPRDELVAQVSLGASRTALTG